MILMQGKGVSDGVVRGTLRFYARKNAAVVKRKGLEPEQETSRFKEAQQKTIAQLERLTERCRTESGEEAAALFETHALLAEDEDYVTCIHETIRSERCSAEYAVYAAGEEFASLLSGMSDAYMQARAADVRDVSHRILMNLTGEAEPDLASDEPVILAADDLAPSETVRLDKRKILGFVTRHGSDNSHTAILARTMGIPAICGLGDALRQEYSGRTVYLDGETGQVILEPDEPSLTAFQEKYRKQQEMKTALAGMKGQEDVTLDGRRIMLYCNIGSPEDISAALDSDAQGIGLFRSEFLYLASTELPSEEQQFQAYRAVAAAMNGKRVIIRTLDVGADKQADYLELKKEENPALGLRAIRISLNRPEIFRTQLRALYRASAYGKIAIMFPMITSVWEVRECRSVCRETMAELEKEGIPYNPETEIGIMIETPASALIADALAREVDFFSVGTNDLTQYTLACDRQMGDLGRFFDPHHPAVLRAVKMAADAAHAAGIWIGICGELAADTALLDTFLAMGIDELSVSPASVLLLRREIRKRIAKDCTLDRLNC